MKTIWYLGLFAAFAMISCNIDELESVAFNGRLTSEVTGEPIPNITIVGRTSGVRGSGLFSSTYSLRTTEKLPHYFRKDSNDLYKISCYNFKKIAS